ncbi:hypothetical protein MJG53_004107 [Ovis ammon polii x Ovis aries]|uniref:Uncharacterized protein n=1 Tax=Ovis ammon polii x Ovis aries TaxID=2918886 RepID=A0ACB9VA37_9CETA|nr:hypothetical protein MJG53_004107 [Ovis ammon polii x Ovis aries]
MLAKYSSTRDMLDADGDTTMSLHSQASATSQRPELGHTEHQRPSSAWRPVALILLTLCLVLLIGLAALGLVYVALAQKNGNGMGTNATNSIKKEFAMPQSYSEFFYSYWTGLSRNGSGKAWLWMDGTPYSSELQKIAAYLPSNLKIRVTVFPSYQSDNIMPGKPSKCIERFCKQVSSSILYMASGCPGSANSLFDAADWAGDLGNYVLLGFLCITSMSEEVTYADLKFQDSSQTENIQKFDKFEKEGNKCKPCPEEWMWHDDNCYLLLSGYQHWKTWQKSDEICSDYNASLLTIKSKRVLEFIKSLQLNHYWLGLSPRKDNKKYGNLDTSIPFDWFTRNTSVISDKMYCGYIQYASFFYVKCTDTKNIVYSHETPDLELGGEAETGAGSIKGTAEATESRAMRGHSAPSKVWYPIACVSLLLNLVILAGLGALGLMYYYKLIFNSKTVYDVQLNVTERVETTTLPTDMPTTVSDLGPHLCSEIWIQYGSNCYNFSTKIICNMCNSDCEKNHSSLMNMDGVKNRNKTKMFIRCHPVHIFQTLLNSVSNNTNQTARNVSDISILTLRIRYNYQFIPRIIPSAMTVKEPSPRASEMESERIENRKVVEQRIKRPGLYFSVSRLISSESTKAMECSEEWIGVRRKCFYFSDDTRNWTASKRFCSSHGSELAQIDTPEDMKFLKKHAGTSMYWIGLSRKLGESWKWTNGTTFNAGFEISGNGHFAFLNSDGVHSSRGFVDIKWICSKPISKTENKLGNQ